MATIEKVATYAAPGRYDSPVELKSRYENFIGGHWVAPVHGDYAENLTPATGEPFTEVPRSTVGGRRARARRRPRCEDRLGGDVDDGALEGPEQDRGRDRGAPRDARRRRELGERQAGA